MKIKGYRINVRSGEFMKRLHPELHFGIAPCFDSLYEELKDRGANIIFGPQDMEYNMRDLLIEDLNGYRLCFGSPIND